VISILYENRIKRSTLAQELKTVGGFVADTHSTKKDRIHRSLLDAGRQLFVQYGLRKTSNKNDVFRAVVEDVVTEMVDSSSHAAVSAPSGKEAIEAAVKTKFLKLHGLLRGSPQGEALLYASNQLSSEAVRTGHAAFVSLLGRLLVEASLTSRAKSKEMAEMIDAACEGIVLKAPTSAAANKRLTLFVDLLVTSGFTQPP
jgi:hypothetical protein